MSIIEKMYFIDLERVYDKIPKSLEADEEDKVYEQLKQALNKKQFKLFNDFINLYSGRLDAVQEKLYYLAFKSALCLFNDIYK